MVNVKVDLLCDDYCTDILINDNSIKYEINLDTITQYYFRTINFIANGGDNITFETYNGGYFGGIAARIIISNNKHSYIIDSKNNENLFSYNILDYSEQQPIADLFYDSQEDNFKELYYEIGYTFGPAHIFEYTNIYFYFIVPEIDFFYNDYIELIFDVIVINLSDYISPDTQVIINNYNYLYFFKDDNVELKGKFVFDDTNEIITLSRFYNYNEKIKYIPKTDTFYYSEKIYFLISQGNNIEFESFGTIELTICPSYCIECTSLKECYTSFTNIQLDEKYFNSNVKIYYNQILINNDETEVYIFSSTNNYIQNENYIQPDLMNCKKIIKDYFNIDNYNITVNYKSSSKRVIVYNSEYSVIVLINDISICIKENIFYDELSKQILECYETCKLCFGKEINNCKLCYNNKILTSRNTCVDVYEECGNDKSLWLFEAIDNGKIDCLTSSNCPLIATNVVSETLECVKSCDNINSYLNCISCNNEETQIYNSCVDLRDSEKSLQIIEENIIKLLETNPLMNSNNKTYFINEYPSSSSIQTNLSEIDLGDCEYKLKEENNIPQNEKLILLQIETKIIGQPTSNLEYYVYSSNGTLLDLSICSDSDINIVKVITDTSNLNYDTAKTLANEGVDIYNINDDFFNNFCNGIDVDNQDLTLNNRIEDVYVNVSFCDDGCEYNGINLDTNKVICTCSLNQNNTQENNNTTIKNKNKFIKVINDLLNNINYKIVVCYQYWLKSKYFKNNSGFYFSIIIFGILQIFLIIICFRWYKSTIIKIKENIKKTNENNENNSLINKKKNKNLNSKYSTSTMDIKRNSIKILHNFYSETSNNNEDNEYKELKKKVIEMNKIKTTFYNYFNYIPSRKKRNNKKKRNKKNSNTELELVTSNNINDEKDKNTNTEEGLNIDNKIENNEEDIDYDELNYFEAIKEDKRKFINIIWDSTLCKIDMIALFIHIGKYEYFPILFSTYLYSLILDFTINALLFSDDIISSKYKNGGELTFWESWILSVCSNIFGKILTYLVCRFTLYNENLDVIINETKNKIKLKKYCILILKNARKNIIIYLIIQNILLLFFIYYLTIFCAIYNRSQMALFKNYLLGNLNSLLYSLGFAFLITLFRYISLQYHNKRFFLISKYLENKT